MTRLTGLIPMLLADDIRETMDFYRDKPGFSVTGTWPEDGKPTWCQLTSGDVKLMFFSFAPHEHDEDHDHDHIDSPTLSGFLYVYPDNVNEAWDALKDKAEVAWPIQNMEHGMREFALKDCNGYTLVFGKSV